MDGRDHQVATDARLAIAASRGDDDAFAVLYERYAPRIGAYLMRLVGDEHLAQDLTHEVFVSALRRLRTDRPPIAFGPWLYRIARNASIDVHRRSQIVRQVPLDGNTEEPSAASANGTAPEAAAEVRQWLEQLRDVLGGMSESHRSVIVLRELEGLSNGEIGRRMGLSRPAVEGLLFRARAKMRREYDDLVSGRRCEAVQTALEQAGNGQQLAGRELQRVARHARACAQCRRHAWELGVSALVRENSGVPPRRVITIPPLVAAMVGRLHLKLHQAARVLGDPSAPSVPWGRVAAAATALAVAGGTVGTHIGSDARTPEARAAVVRGASPSSATGRAIRASAPAIASPAAGPTTLRASADREPVASVAPPAPAVAPAGAPPASPAAAPTALPSHPAATHDHARHEAGPAPAVEPAATDHPAMAAVVGAVKDADQPAAEPATAVAEVVKDVTERDAGGVVSQAAETASAVLEDVSQAVPADPPAAQVVDQAAQTVTEVADAAPQVALPATAPPVPDPAPAPPPVPVPVPDVPVPAAPTTAPDVAPAAPSDASAPAVDATPPPGDPRVQGATLAERRRASGSR